MTHRPELKVRLRDRDIWLPPGRYLVGRSGNCHIVIDDRLVSRRHAELRVFPWGASIRDAGSINGVFVDGIRIGTEPEPLRAGSRFVIGNEVLEVDVGTSPSEARERVDTLTGGEPVIPAADDAEAEEPTIRTLHSLAPAGEGRAADSGHDTTTIRGEALEVFGPFAMQAARSGRGEEAERLLGVHLRTVLAGVRGGTFPKREGVARAVDLALELGLAGRPGWCDYAVELLDSLRMPPPSIAIVEKLEKAARASGVDVEKLTRWTRTLRQKLGSLEVEDLELLDRLEALSGALLRDRRR